MFQFSATRKKHRWPGRRHTVKTGLCTCSCSAHRRAYASAYAWWAPPCLYTVHTRCVTYHKQNEIDSDAPLKKAPVQRAPSRRQVQTFLRILMSVRCSRKIISENPATRTRYGQVLQTSTNEIGDHQPVHRYKSEEDRAFSALL